jgi:uncharacterized protein YndB with AHSA1/START domain
MRLRSRSRSTLSPTRGAAFRLELAEGPAIHVITGIVHDIRPHELLSLGWVHQNTNDHGSTVDVTFESAHLGTALTLVHRGITSRREASWLMRFWSTVLRRLETYVAADSAAASARRIGDVAIPVPETREADKRRSSVGTTFARSA